MHDEEDFEHNLFLPSASDDPALVLPSPYDITALMFTSYGALAVAHPTELYQFYADTYAMGGVWLSMGQLSSTPCDDDAS